MLELALRNKIKISKKLIFRHFCTHLFTFLSYLSAWLIKKKKDIYLGQTPLPTWWSRLSPGTERTWSGYHR